MFAGTEDDARLSLAPGEVIAGKYVVERLLGQGGMGAVFAARQERLERRVAIKVLLPAALRNPEVVARFEREARAAGSLLSEHVTRVHDVGTLENGMPYLVMELLEGEDVAEALERRGPFSVAEVVRIVTQAGDAIAEAHAVGIVHRDLKPANLFLATRANGTVTVKVLDFGISKAPPSRPGPDLTSTTAVMGSPLYMSPEQLTGSRNVDGRTDIWSLGATMYQLLTGAPPFPGETLAAIGALVLMTEPVPLRARRSDVPAALEAAVMRCLRRDPAERFATVAELVSALQAAQGHPVSTPISAAALATTLASPLPPPPGGSGRPPHATPAAARTPQPVSSTQRSHPSMRPAPANERLSVGNQEGAHGQNRLVLSLVAAVGLAAMVSAAALVRSNRGAVSSQDLSGPAIGASSVLASSAPPPNAQPSPGGSPAASATAVALSPVLETPPPLETPLLHREPPKPKTHSPVDPAAAPSAAVVAARPAAPPTTAASKKSGCRLVSSFDSDGERHFEEKCDN